MSISIDKLIEEKTLLQKDFDQLNQKIKQGDLGSEAGKMGKKEKVDASIFKQANQKDY